jgi:alpha-1,2-mannosyltransferase
MSQVVDPDRRATGESASVVSGYRGLGPQTRRAGCAALIAACAAIAVYCFIALHGGLSSTIQIEHIDLNVYRAGARVLIDGGDLYGPLPPAAPGLELPFTYPPIAAVLLAPLALLPVALDSLISIAVTALLLGLVMRLVLSELGLRSRPRLNWAVIVAMPAALILDPVRVALLDGQIDVVLMALVTLDTIGPGARLGPCRLRGALVGLAAALKLTPAVFVLFFLVRGDRRSVATAAVSFAAFTGIGMLVAPRDSIEYWGHTVFQTGRIGSVWYGANQSLEAMLARAGLTGRGLSLGWLLGCLLVLAMAWTTMRRAAGHANVVGTLLLNALAELLISPISWTHHWVWIVPMIVALGAVDRETGMRGLRTFSKIGFAVFALGPQWLLPHGGDRELHWALWEQLLGSSYVWFGLALLAACAVIPTPAFAADLLRTIRIRHVVSVPGIAGDGKERVDDVLESRLERCDVGAAQRLESNA